MTNLNCSIVSVGNEIMLGIITDTNAAWLTSRVTELGWRVRRILGVGDALTDITAALKTAASDSDLLLLTGGLGPTADDRTREAIAQAMNTGLQEVPELVEQIRARFAAIDRPMKPGNLVQARLPQGASGIPNPCGTAPGISGNIGKCRFFAMPGVPREMREMFTTGVLPHIQHAAQGNVTRRRELHVFGIGESTVGQSIAGLMHEDDNPGIGTMVHDGIVTVRIVARGAGERETLALLGKAEEHVRQKLGDAVFGSDQETLEDAVVKSLREREQTLALAESCTGGMIAARIVNVRGASGVFTQGMVTYANAAKINLLGVPADLLDAHGAVSREVACSMAQGAKRLAGTTWALAVTGIAGPSGGTKNKPVGTVWLALCGPSGICYTHQRFGYDRHGNRLRATNMALDLLRRAICGLTFPWEMGFDD